MRFETSWLHAVFFLLCLLAAVGSQAQSGRDQDAEPAVPAVRSVAERLIVLRPGTGRGFTAFPINDEGLFLTARAITDDLKPGARVEALLRPGTDRMQRAIAYLALDGGQYALFHVPGLATVPVQFADAGRLRTGDALYVAGFPLLHAWQTEGRSAGPQIHTGRFDRVWRAIATRPRLAVRGRLQIPHIGSPVMRADGAVVGMIDPPHAGAQDDPPVTLAIGPIREALQRPALQLEADVPVPADRSKPLSFTLTLLNVDDAPVSVAAIRTTGSRPPGTIAFRQTETAGPFQRYRFQTTASRDRGSLDAWVGEGAGREQVKLPDRPVWVGDASVRLSEMKSIHRDHVLLLDGRVLPGQPEGLGVVETPARERIDLDSQRPIVFDSAHELAIRVVLSRAGERLKPFDLKASFDVAQVNQWGATLPTVHESSLPQPSMSLRRNLRIDPQAGPAQTIETENAVVEVYRGRNADRLLLWSRTKPEEASARWVEARAKAVHAYRNRLLLEADDILVLDDRTLRVERVIPGPERVVGVSPELDLLLQRSNRDDGMTAWDLRGRQMAWRYRGRPLDSLPSNPQAPVPYREPVVLDEQAALAVAAGWAAAVADKQIHRAQLTREGWELLPETIELTHDSKRGTKLTSGRDGRYLMVWYGLDVGKGEGGPTVELFGVVPELERIGTFSDRELRLARPFWVDEVAGKLMVERPGYGQAMAFDIPGWQPPEGGPRTPRDRAEPADLARPLPPPLAARMRSLAPAAMLLDLPVDGGRLAAWGRQGADLYFGFSGSPRDGEPAQTIYRISSETWRMVARRNWDRPAYAMKRTGDGLVVVLGPGRTVAGSQVLVLDPETLATRRSIDLPSVKDRKASIAEGVVAFVSWGNGGRLVFLNRGEAVQPDVWTDEDHDAAWERKLAEPARPPSNPLEVALSPDGTRLYTRQFSSLGRWRVSVQDRELTPEVVTDPISSRPFRPLVDPAGEFIVTSADGVVFRADDLASPVRRLNAKIHRVIRLHGRCLAETEDRLLLDVESGQPFCHLGSGRVLAADPGGATLLATDDELVFVRIPPDPAELLPEPSPVRSDRPLHVAKQQIEDRTVLVYDEMEFHDAVIPADPNEPVVAVAPLGRLSMIDRRSHREILTLDFGEEVSSLGRCANGIVAALPESQRVWLLDAQTLEPMNSWPVPNLAGAISTPASASVLVTGTDQLGEIDTDAGTVRYAAQAPLLWVQRPPPESPNSSLAVSTSNDGRSIVALLRHSQKLTLNAFLTSSGQYLVHGGRFFKRDAERWVDFGESSREPLGKLRLPGGDLVIDRPGRVLRLPAIERPVLSLENAVRDGAAPRYTASPDRGMIYEIGESIHAWSATGGRRWQLELESAGAARAYVAPEGVVGKHLWAIWQGRLVRVSLDSADQFQTADSSSGTPADRLLRTLALEKDAYLASLKPTRPNQRISLGAPRGSRYRRPVDLEGEQLLPLAPPIGGRFLILARRDGVVQRLDTRRWTVTSRLEFDQPISDAAVGAWGVAVLLPNQPQVVILDGQTLNPMGSVSLAEKPVLLAASAEYANLVVVDQSMNVHVVDPQSGDVLATLPGPKDTSESPYAVPARAAIGPNGRYVFVSSPQDGLHRFRLTGPEPAFEQRLRAGHWRMPPGSPYLVVNMAAGLHPGLDDDDFCLYAPEDLDQPVRYLGQHRSRPDQVNWCYDPSRRIFLFAGAHNYFAFGIDGRRVSTPEQFSFPNDGRRCVVLDAERYLEYGPRQCFVVEAAGLPRRPIQAAAEPRPASRRIRMTRPARSEGFDAEAVWSADGRTMYVKSGTFLRAYDWPTLAEIGKTVAPTAWGQTADGLLAVHDFGDEARVLDPRTLEGIKSFPLRVTGGPDQPVPRFRVLAADPAAHFAVGLTIHRDRGRPATVAGFVIDTQFGELLPVFRIDELEGAFRIAGELDRGRELHFDQIRGSELRDDGAALLIDMGERLGLLSVEDMVPRWQQISQQLKRGHHTGMLTVGDWLVVPNAGLGGVQDVHELRSRLLAYRWPTLHRPAREMDLGAPCRADRLALASASPHLLAPAVGGQLQRVNLDSRAIDRFALDVLVTAESRLAWGPAERWAAVTNPPELDLVQLVGEPQERVGRLRSVRLSELPQIRGRRDRESGERAAGAFFELADGELVLRWDEPDGRRLDFKRWWVSDDSRMAVEVRGDIRRIGLVFGDEQWWLTPPDPQWHRYEFVNRNGTIAFFVDGQAASPRGSPMPATPSRPVHLSMELESGEDVRIRHAVFGRNR